MCCMYKNNAYICIINFKNKKMEIKKNVLISVNDSDLENGVFYNNEVTEVSDNCFNGMDNLVKVILPKVKIIGSYCFSSNNSLTGIELPALTTCGSYCFRSNSSLTGIELPALTTCDSYCFSSNSSLTGIELPALTTCGSDCFRYNDKLTSVALPALTTCGSYCFRSNSSLTGIELPALTTCDSYCFRSNSSLTGIELPALTTCGSDCFSYNDKLTSVALPALTTCDSYCFSSNSSLTGIELLNFNLSVKNVDGYCYVIENTKTSKGVKIYSGYNFEYIKNKIISKQISFVAEKENFTAHGETIKKAISDLNFKIVSDKLKNEPIKKDTLITVNHYRLITGACEMGVKDWMDKNNITKDKIKASELLILLEKTNAYGLQNFKKLLNF